nr:hemerythrin domain-containing protein [Dechloromonas sp.]
MAGQITFRGVARAALSGDNDAASSCAPVNEAELPSELLTGNAHLDVEHGLLMGNIQGLRKICIDHRNLPHCGGCQHERRLCCENELVAMLGDLLAFILDHFRNEERIMRESLLQVIDREVCEAHMEDHAAISGKIQEIVAALDQMKTVSLIRELDSLLSRWVRNHIMLHDRLLARWIEREDSMLRRSLPPAVI